MTQTAAREEGRDYSLPDLHIINARSDSLDHTGRLMAEQHGNRPISVAIYH